MKQPEPDPKHAAPFSPQPSLCSVEEAVAIVSETGVRYPDVSVPLSEAMGRFLAQEVRAERDLPPFDRVTMDGIAISHAAYAEGRRSFRIQATQPAGAPPLHCDSAEDAIRVMTGAVLPAGADCVVPREEYREANGIATLAEAANPAPGQYVHAQGSDLKQGGRLLAPGVAIRSNEMSVIASSGLATVRVCRAPTVAIVSTGDELVDVGRPILPHQVRMSTHHALHAALSRLGARRISTFHIPDDFDQVRNTLVALLGRFDLIITLGGVAAGDFDFVSRALESLRIPPMVQGVAQRPGKPLWFGLHDQKAIFGLPGNPLSTLVCLHKYVRPFFERAIGGEPAPPIPAVLEADVEFAPALTFFPPVRMRHTESGQIAVTPARYNTSGNMVALAETDGFIELPAGPSHFPAGSIVPLTLWI